MNDNEWKIRGFCEDEEGERFSLGEVTVEADSLEEAENKSWKELWDSRLTSAGCLYRIKILEYPDWY